MWKHVLIWLVASICGLAGGFLAGPLLQFLALISIFGGPGFVELLLGWSEDPRAFWYSFIAVGMLALAVLYGLWGLKALLFALLARKKGGS
jgi:hypothetical protein